MTWRATLLVALLAQPSAFQAHSRNSQARRADLAGHDVGRRSPPVSSGWGARAST